MKTAIILSLLSFLFHIQTNAQNTIEGEVCRNARCTSFFVHHYTNLFTFFKLRSFEDFFDLCVPSI